LSYLINYKYLIQILEKNFSIKVLSWNNLLSFLKNYWINSFPVIFVNKNKINDFWAKFYNFKTSIELKQIKDEDWNFILLHHWFNNIWENNCNDWIDNDNDWKIDKFDENCWEMISIWYE